MNRAESLEPQAGLLPLSRPLMTGEVLDAAFRLYRASLLRCLPYSGLAVLVLELPTLYATFLGTDGLWFTDSRTDRRVVFVVALLLGVALFGVITLRLHAVSRGLRPRFRSELFTVLRRWPSAIIATLGAFGLPVLLYAFSTSFNAMLPGVALMVLAVPALWPTALLVAALPAFWCDRLGAFDAIARAVHVSRRRSWRMVGAVLATLCMVAVFYVLVAILMGVIVSTVGRTDIVIIAAISSALALVIGAFGVPFVLAVLLVAYEDLRLRAGTHA